MCSVKCVVESPCISESERRKRIVEGSQSLEELQSQMFERMVKEFIAYRDKQIADFQAIFGEDRKFELHYYTPMDGGWEIKVVPADYLDDVDYVREASIGDEYADDED